MQSYICFIKSVILPIQDGRLPFRQTGPSVTDNSQVCILVPLSRYPELHEYVTTLPSIKPSVKLLPPLSGVPGSSQITKKNTCVKITVDIYALHTFFRAKEG